jgi:potassium-transporting ATPase KdpC subunit
MAELHPHVPPPEPPGRAPSPLRASLAFLLLLALVTGFVVPQAVVAFAHDVAPGSAGGSLLRFPNGTAYGSSDLGENFTNPALFWPRPSMIDYQAFVGNGTGAGNEVPPGPTDPALLNETAYYVAYYCTETRANLTVHCLENASVPIDLLTPSTSGLDPDITPAAALVQIPRIAFYTGLPQEFLRVLVNEQTISPYAGVFGPAYVNVLTLDQALLRSLPAGTGY